MNIKQELISFWGKRNVTAMATDISDYLIKVPGIELYFALKILDNGEDALKEYKAMLFPIIQLRGTPKTPLVAAFPNADGSVSLGVIIRWQFGAPAFEDPTILIPMIEDKRATIVDMIKSSDETIRVLERSNCKIVKHLYITDKFKDIEYDAEIVYLRDLSLSYRMKSRNDLTDIERFNYYLKGIPEEDYPNDKLDEGIIEAIKDQGYKIKDNRPVSQLLLFSSELRDLKTKYGKRDSVPVQFMVLPSYSSLLLMVGKEINTFNLGMYIDSPNEFTFQKRNLTINISLNSVDDYYEFYDGTKTLCCMFQFLNQK